jgi:hypothetical protein
MASKAKRYSSKEIIQLEALARAHTERALRTICGICENGKNDDTRLHAADLILSYGWGKPKQALVGGSPTDTPVQIVIRDLMAERLALEKERAKSDRPPPA